MIGCIQCEDRPATALQQPLSLGTELFATTPAVLASSSRSKQIFVHFMENAGAAERTNDFTLDPQFLCGDPTLYYPCADHRGCVMVVDLFNGVKDCPDGSDEDDHYVNKCAAGIHKCAKNQQCVQLASGSYDCIDSKA